MARVIRKKSKLAQIRNRQVLIHMGGCGLGLVSGILALAVGLDRGPLLLVCLLALISVAGVFMAVFSQDGVDILSAGVCGEKIACTMLAKVLPDTYCCITNARISHGNRQRELDLIVLGPSGVYVVEVKNVSGKIQGDYSDKVLHQEKRQGDKAMLSPVYQVRQQADILWRYLKARGIRVGVQGAVLFVNDHASVCINGIPADGIPVFAVSDGGEKALAQYLTRSVSTPLPREELRRIRKAIK